MVCRRNAQLSVYASILRFACSIMELQDQFGIAHDTTSHQLPHMAASVAIMAVPGLMAWAADTSMRLAYNSGPLKAAARTAITGSLQMAGATAASVTSIASLSGPLVPFINLSYGYLPLVSGGGGVCWAHGVLSDTWCKSDASRLKGSYSCGICMACKLSRTW